MTQTLPQITGRVEDVGGQNQIVTRRAKTLRRRLLFRINRPEELVRDEMRLTIFPFVIGGSLLEPLYALSQMGYGQDERLRPAWDILASKRDEAGRYILDWQPKARFDPGEKGQPNKSLRSKFQRNPTTSYLIKPCYSQRNISVEKW